MSDEKNIWDSWIRETIVWGDMRPNAPAEDLYNEIPADGALDVLQLASGTARDTRYLLSHPGVARLTAVDYSPMASRVARDVVVVGLGGVEKRPQVLEKPFELLTPEDVGMRHIIYAIAAFPFVKRDDTNSLMPMLLDALHPGGRFIGNFALNDDFSMASGAAIHGISTSDSDGWVRDAKAELEIKRLYRGEYHEFVEPNDPTARAMEFYATRRLG